MFEIDTPLEVSIIFLIFFGVKMSWFPPLIFSPRYVDFLLVESCSRCVPYSAIVRVCDSSLYAHTKKRKGNFWYYLFICCV